MTALEEWLERSATGHPAVDVSVLFEERERARDTAVALEARCDQLERALRLSLRLSQQLSAAGEDWGREALALADAEGQGLVREVDDEDLPGHEMAGSFPGIRFDAEGLNDEVDARGGERARGP